MKILRLGQSLPSSNGASAGGFVNEYSLDFDGVDDKVDCGNSATLSLVAAKGASFSMWIKTSSKSAGMSFKYLFGKRSTSINGNEYSCFINSSGYLVFDIAQAGIGTLRITGAIDVATNNWTHVAITWNGSLNSGLVLYVNGSADSGAAVTGSITATNTTTGSFTIATVNGSFAVGFVAGNIDEMAYWTSVLSASNITAIYNSGKPDDLTSLSPLSWWRMGDPTGTGAFPTITDQGSASNDGTMTNMASGDIVTVVP